MTTKLLNWASNEGQITKSKLSGGRRAKFLLRLVVMIYNLLRTEGYLGNVGLVHFFILNFRLCSWVKKVMVPDSNLKNWPRFRFLVPYLALYFSLISLSTS